MKNELLLKQAIELLQEVNPEELETLQISNTKYDDGSTGFSVELNYPSEESESEKAEKITLCDLGGDIIEISKAEGSV